MTPSLELSIWRALEAVEDPELGVDIVNLGLVYGVAVSGSAVTVKITFTAMGCPAGPELLRAVQAAASGVEGVDKVTVDLTFDPPWSPARVTEEGREQLICLGYL
jgi:metal-sulfur cluster biosynthetic enzyme